MRPRRRNGAVQPHRSGSSVRPRSLNGPICYHSESRQHQDRQPQGCNRGMSRIFGALGLRIGICFSGGVPRHPLGMPSQREAYRSLYGAWRTACKRAGVTGPTERPRFSSRLATDSRAQSGAGWRVALGGKKLTGHKTGAVYRRHAIVSESDFREGVAKLARMTTEQQQSGVDG
jgi:hypothetical protein